MYVGNRSLFSRRWFVLSLTHASVHVCQQSTLAGGRCDFVCKAGSVCHVPCRARDCTIHRRMVCSELVRVASPVFAA